MRLARHSDPIDLVGALAVPLALFATACSTSLAPPEGRSSRSLMMRVATQAVAIEVCDDGVDNDSDGDVDLEDPDCKLALWQSRWGNLLGFDIEYSSDGNDVIPDDVLDLDTDAYGRLTAWYDPWSDASSHGQTELYDEKDTLIGVVQHVDGEAWGLTVVVADGDKHESLLVATEGGWYWIPEIAGTWSTTGAVSR